MLDAVVRSVGSVLDHDLLVVSNARRFVSEGIQTELHATFGDAVTQELTVGLRLHHDQIDRNHVERAYSLIALQLVANGDDPKARHRPRVLRGRIRRQRNERLAERNRTVRLWHNDPGRSGVWHEYPDADAEPDPDSVSAEDLYSQRNRCREDRSTPANHKLQ